MEMEKIRVLLIEDEESDFLVTEALLGRIGAGSVDLAWTSSYEDGLARLRSERWDVCLLDYLLGERTGVELLEELGDAKSRTPVVMLTGKGDRSVDLEAMKAGAVDYLVKGRIGPDLLERSIRYAVERHRTQAALRASEERHRGMFDHLPLGLYRVSPDGGYMDANPALIRMLGYPEPAELDRQYARYFFVSPADRERFWTELRERGVVLGFETRLRRTDGSLLRVRNTSRVHRNSAGETLYLEGSVEDVTHLRSAEELEEEANLYRAVAEHAGVGIALLDENGRVRRANRCLEKLTGLPARDLHARSGWSLVHPEDQAKVAEGFERVQRGRAERFRVTARLAVGRDRAPRVQLTMVPPAGRNAETGSVLFLLEEVVETADVPA